MNTPSWIEILTVLITLGGFGAVVYQLRQLESATRGEIHDMLSSQMREVLTIFKDYPELRPHFYENKPLERDHPQYDRALIVAEYYFDLFEHVVQKRRKMSTELWKTWKYYIQRLYFGSPVLQAFIQEYRHMYTSEVLTLTIEAQQAKSIPDNPAAT
jgi:hypothetical protein